MGIPADLIGTTVARAIAAIFLGGPHPGGYWRNFCEVYFSYQSANIVRTGVNIDERLTNKAKIRLNYWYSVVIYSIFTAADKLAQSAIAEVSYAMLWPLLSQSVATYIVTPIMFGKFPKKDFLDKLKNNTVLINSVEQEFQAEVHSLEALAAKRREGEAPVALFVEARLGGPSRAANAEHLRSKIAATRAPIIELKWKIRWLKFFRNGLAEGAQIPMRRFIMYWIIKTMVSVGMSSMMIVLYFTTRFFLVGFGEHTGPLSRLVHWVSHTFAP